MSYSDVYAKSQDTGFRTRLRVALMEHCRFELQRAQGADSANRWAWKKDLARVIRNEVTNETALTRLGIYLLLPENAYDEDSDSALQTFVGSHFYELAATDMPA